MKLVDFSGACECYFLVNLLALMQCLSAVWFVTSTRPYVRVAEKTEQPKSKRKSGFSIIIVSSSLYAALSIIGAVGASTYSEILIQIYGYVVLAYGSMNAVVCKYLLSKFYRFAHFYSSMFIGATLMSVLTFTTLNAQHSVNTSDKIVSV